MPGSAPRAQDSLAATPSPAVSEVTASTTPAEAPNNRPAPIDDKHRSYTKEELIATIPADDHYKSPLRLTALLPLVGPNFLVTRHQGESRPDRLALWKKVGDNSYQLLDVMYCDPAAPEEKFQSPIVIDVDKQVPPPSLQLLNIVKSGGRKPVEIPFVIDSERMELTPAAFESPQHDERMASTPTPSHQPEARIRTRVQASWGQGQTAWVVVPSPSIEVGMVKLPSGSYYLMRHDERADDGSMRSSWKLVPVASTTDHRAQNAPQ